MLPGKKIVIAVSVVFMFITGMIFAGGGGQRGSPNSNPGTLSGEVRFSWWGNEGRNNATIEAIRYYESLHPGTRIVPEFAAFDGYYNKLIAQIAAGNAPDIFTMNAEWVPAVVEVGGLTDLSGLIDVSSHNPEVSKACSLNGRMYGVNASLNANGLIYNKTQAEELGIKMPAGDYTWDDLVKILEEAYRKSGGKTYGIPDWRVRNALESSIPQWCMTHLGKEAPFPWTETEILITGDDVAAYMDYWNKAPEGVLLPPDESSLLAATDDPITTRRTFMGGTWAGTFASVLDKTKDEIVLIEFPNNNKGSGAAVSARPGLVEGVFSGSRNKNLAVDFLAWFVNDPEAGRILKSVRGVLPSSAQRTALVSDPSLVTDVDRQVISFVDSVYNKRVNPYSTGPSVVYTLFGTGYLRTVGSEVAFGRITPQEAGRRFDEMKKELLD
jgi:multiple sugar transport system substrate-binding protein